MKVKVEAISQKAKSEEEKKSLLNQKDQYAPKEFPERTEGRKLLGK